MFWCLTSGTKKWMESSSAVVVEWGGKMWEDIVALFCFEIA
jgi:hypothetical protein